MFKKFAAYDLLPSRFLEIYVHNDGSSASELMMTMFSLYSIAMMFERYDIIWFSSISIFTLQILGKAQVSCFSGKIIISMALHGKVHLVGHLSKTSMLPFFL